MRDHILDLKTYKALAGALRYEAVRLGVEVDIYLDVGTGHMVMKPTKPQPQNAKT